MDCLDELAVEDGKLQHETICLEHDLDNMGLSRELDTIDRETLREWGGFGAVLAPEKGRRLLALME